MKKTPYARLVELIEGSIENGYSPKPVNNVTGRWVLGLGALTPKGLNLSEKKSVALDDTKFQNRLLKEGDFLVSRSNTREKVGQASLYKGGLSNCIYPDLMMRFRINKSLTTIDYIDHYLRSPITQNYFASRAAGSNLSMVKITKSILAELPIYHPSLQEQKAIAAILSTWDEAIEKIERLIASKERLFEWLVNELIGKRKAEVSLGELCPLEIGNRIVKNEEDLGYLEIGDIDVRTKDYQIDNKEKRPVSGAVKVPTNTLLISTVRPTRGAITRTKSELYVSSAFCKLRLPNNFYFYCLYQRRFSNHLKHRQSGATYPTVKDKDILTFKIPALSEAEQKRIIRILNSAKQEIDLLKKLSDGYRMQKQALMQKLLTGKWRVNFKG